MNLQTARSTIETYLAANWTHTPIRWQNVQAVTLGTPVQQTLEFGQTDYLAADIDIIDSRTVTVPARCIRYGGLLIFSVCVKQGKGASIVDQYGDQLINLFENKTLGTSPDVLRIRNLTGSTIYNAETSWYVNLLQFAFYFNRIVPNP